MVYPERRKSSVSFRIDQKKINERKTKNANISFNIKNSKHHINTNKHSKLQEISIISKSSLIDLLAADFKSKNTNEKNDGARKSKQQNDNEQNNINTSNIDKSNTVRNSAKLSNIDIKLGNNPYSTHKNLSTKFVDTKAHELDETFAVSFFDDVIEKQISNVNIENQKLANNNYFDNTNKNNFCAEDELNKSIDMSNSINVSFFAEKSENKITDVSTDYNIINNKIVDLYKLFSFDIPEINNCEEDVIFYLTKLYFNVKDFDYINAIEIVNKFKKRGLFLNNQKIDEICKYFEEKSVLKISDDDKIYNEKIGGEKNGDNELDDEIIENSKRYKKSEDANNKECEDVNSKETKYNNNNKYYKEMISEKDKQIVDMQHEILKINEQYTRITSLLRKENHDLINDLKCKSILLKEIEERMVDNANTTQISVIDEIITKGNEITKNMKDEYMTEIEKKEKVIKELKKEKYDMEVRIGDLEDAVEGLAEKLRCKKMESML
ncbi:hypothetical protein BDAP_000479 [Binucleata daphniae]